MYNEALLCKINPQCSCLSTLKACRMIQHEARDKHELEQPQECALHNIRCSGLSCMCAHTLLRKLHSRQAHCGFSTGCKLLRVQLPWNSTFNPQCSCLSTLKACRMIQHEARDKHELEQPQECALHNIRCSGLSCMCARASRFICQLDKSRDVMKLARRTSTCL